MNTLIPSEAIGDAELVTLSLEGDRDAFGAIIARYQSLICALTYSACGDRGSSEDLAQETFLSAWRSLHNLQDPSKLKSWLCGIARNLAKNALRWTQRTQTALADPLQTGGESAAADPSEQAASKEEEALVWQTLEAMAPEYREPLVLFYREGQSTRAVAEALDLSEDAVSQRLSRGRSTLRQNVARTVETALGKGAPGKAFTAVVLAALPFAGTSAKAASMGTFLAKGGGAAKGAAATGAAGGLLAMLGGMIISLKTHVDDAKSPRERRLLQQNIAIQVIGVVIVGLVYYGLTRQRWCVSFPARAVLNAAVIFLGVSLGCLLLPSVSRRRREIQISDGTYVETEWTLPRRVTDEAGDCAGMGSSRRTLRFVAFALSWAIFAAIAAPWHRLPIVAVGFVAWTLLLTHWLYRRVRERPRFQVLKTERVYLAMLFLGLLNLVQFDLWQYRGPAAAVATPALAIAFNVATIFGYAALYIILRWWEKRGFRHAAP